MANCRWKLLLECYFLKSLSTPIFFSIIYFGLDLDCSKVLHKYSPINPVKKNWKPEIIWKTEKRFWIYEKDDEKSSQEDRYSCLHNAVNITDKFMEAVKDLSKVLWGADLIDEYWED